MSTSVAKQNFSDLVQQVFRGGQEVIVTSRGKPQVRIVAADEAPHTSPGQQQNSSQLIADIHTLQDRIRTRRKNSLIDSNKEIAAMRQERDAAILGVR